MQKLVRGKSRVEREAITNAWYQREPGSVEEQYYSQDPEVIQRKKQL